MTYLGHGFQLAVNTTHVLVSHILAMFCLSFILRPLCTDLAEVGALSKTHTIGGTGVLKIKLASISFRRAAEAVNFSDLTSWPVP